MKTLSFHGRWGVHTGRFSQWMAFLIAFLVLFLEGRGADKWLKDWMDEQSGLGIGEAVGQTVSSAVQARQANLEFKADFKAARRRFADSLPDKPDRPAAEKQLQDYLFQKDLHYLFLDLYSALDIGAFGNVSRGLMGPLDGGIPSAAQPFFDAWSRQVANRVAPDGAGRMVKILNLYQTLPTAIQESRGYWEIYRIVRDEAEYAAVGLKVVPEMNPLSLLRARPRIKAVAETVEEYQAMAGFFGENRMRETFDTVRAHANAEAHVKDLSALKVPMTGSSHAFDVWLTLLAAADRRSYFTTAYALDLLSSNYVEDRRLDWAGAAAKYETLRIAFGEAALHAAVDATMHVETTRSFLVFKRKSQALRILGTQGLRTGTSEGVGQAVIDALLKGGPENELRLLVTEGEKLTSHDAVNARVASLFEKHRRNQVLDLTTRVLARSSGAPQVGIGVRDPWTNIIRTLEPITNNPDFIAWEKCPVGSSARYIRRDLVAQVRNMVPEQNEVQFELVQKMPFKVVVRQTTRPLAQKWSSEALLRTFQQKEIEIPSFIEDLANAPFHTFEDEARRGMRQSGPEEIVRACGREFRCVTQLSEKGNAKLALSAEVPGGLVQFSLPNFVTELTGFGQLEPMLDREYAAWAKFPVGSTMTVVEQKTKAAPKGAPQETTTRRTSYQVKAVTPHWITVAEQEVIDANRANAGVEKGVGDITRQNILPTDNPNKSIITRQYFEPPVEAHGAGTAEALEIAGTTLNCRRYQVGSRGYVAAVWLSDEVPGRFVKQTWAYGGFTGESWIESMHLAKANGEVATRIKVSVPPKEPALVIIPAQILLPKEPAGTPANGATVKQRTWKVGDRALVHWSGGPLWYPATIATADGNRYFVKFDDGDSEWTTSERIVAENLQVGDRILANWRKQGRYFPGKITARNGDQIHILYDDGDQEDTTIAVVRVQTVRR